MIFPARINGIPCQCHVTHYRPAKAMVVYGSGFGDAHPPEPGEFEYELLTRDGRRASWLDQYISPSVTARLLEEYRFLLENWD